MVKTFHWAKYHSTAAVRTKCCKDANNAFTLEIKKKNHIALLNSRALDACFHLVLACYRPNMPKIESSIIQGRPLCGQATTTTIWSTSRKAVRHFSCDNRGGQPELKTGKQRVKKGWEQSKKERGEWVGLKATKYYDPHSTHMCINCLTVSNRRVRHSKLYIRARARPLWNSSLAARRQQILWIRLQKVRPEAHFLTYTGTDHVC